VISITKHLIALSLLFSQGYELAMSPQQKSTVIHVYNNHQKSRSLSQRSVENKPGAQETKKLFIDIYKQFKDALETLVDDTNMLQQNGDTSLSTRMKCCAIFICKTHMWLEKSKESAPSCTAGFSSLEEQARQFREKLLKQPAETLQQTILQANGSMDDVD